MWHPDSFVTNPLNKKAYKREPQTIVTGRTNVNSTSAKQNEHTELGWEAIYTHLKVKYLLNKGLINKDTTILTNPGREFLYTNCFNRVLTTSPVETRGILNLTEELQNFLDSGAGANYLSYQASSRKCIAKQDFYLNFDLRDSINLPVVSDSGSYICATYRKRTWGSQRNVDDNYLQALKSLAKVTKVYLVGPEGEEICDGISLISSSLDEWLSRTISPNCKGVVGTATGTILLAWMVSGAKIYMLDFDNCLGKSNCCLHFTAETNFYNSQIVKSFTNSKEFLGYIEDEFVFDIREFDSNEKTVTINTPQGIGDIAWILQKLFPYFDRVNLNILAVGKDDIQHRAKKFLQLCPRVGAVNYSYVSSEKYNSVAHRRYDVRPIINNPQVVHDYAINKPLEEGIRLEDVDPDTKVEWFLPFDVSEKRNTESYIVLYVSGSKTDFTWTPEKWSRLILDLYSKHNLYSYKLVLFGAHYDEVPLRKIGEILSVHRITIEFKIATKPKEAICIIRDAKLFIGYQSGQNFIASNYDVPQVMLYFPFLKPMLNTWCKPGAAEDKTFNAFTFDQTVEEIAIGCNEVCEKLTK